MEVATPKYNTNKYKKGNINSLGYINDKAFHTKIRNIIDQNTIDEEANIGIAETFQSATAIRLNQFSTQNPDTQDLTQAELFHPYNVPDHNYTGTLLANNYGKNDILTSEFGTATFTDDYTSQAFTDTSTPADTVSGGDFIQPDYITIQE